MQRSSYFDVKDYLNSINVGFNERGKNIGIGWIGLEECPFCGVQGNHFGVNLKSKVFSCWGCGEKGGPVKLVQMLSGCTYSKAAQIVGSTETDEEVEDRHTGNTVILPSNLGPLQENAKSYLLQRNYAPNQMILNHQIQECGSLSYLKHENFSSDFRWRIFIPIVMRRKLVSYTCRDYSRKRDPRYKHPILEACIIPASSTIYNMDTVKRKRALILEGPTDVWRMGDEAISLQGIEVSRKQIRFIAEMNLEKVVVLFDAGKEKAAETLAETLVGVVKKVQVASLPFGDPGELNPGDAIKFKQQLLWG